MPNYEELKAYYAQFSKEELQKMLDEYYVENREKIDEIVRIKESDIVFGSSSVYMKYEQMKAFLEMKYD